MQLNTNQSFNYFVATKTVSIRSVFYTQNSMVYLASKLNLESSQIITPTLMRTQIFFYDLEYEKLKQNSFFIITYFNKDVLLDCRT